MKKTPSGTAGKATETETMDDMLRARCKRSLHDLVQRAATIMELDEADIIRIGAKTYAASVVYRGVPNVST